MRRLDRGAGTRTGTRAACVGESVPDDVELAGGSIADEGDRPDHDDGDQTEEKHVLDQIGASLLTLQNRLLLAEAHVRSPLPRPFSGLGTRATGARLDTCCGHSKRGELVDVRVLVTGSRGVLG